MPGPPVRRVALWARSGLLHDLIVHRENADGTMPPVIFPHREPHRRFYRGVCDGERFHYFEGARH